MGKRQKLWLILLAGWIAVIFSHSLAPAAQSSAESSCVLQAVRECFGAAGIPGTWLTEHFIRKTAHFAEYAGMGFLLYQNLKYVQSDKTVKVLAGSLVVLAVPFADETIQLFADGRAAMIQDVWLDLSGAFAGMAFAAGLAVLAGRIRRRN